MFQSSYAHSDQAHPASNGTSGRSSGLFSHATAWLGIFLAHLRVRLQLAGLESQQAAGHYGVILGLALAGLIVLVFGYFFACLAVAFLLAWVIGGDHAWLWVLSGLALVHFGAAAGLFFWAKAKLREPMFSATLDELRKDQEWLTEKTANQP